MLLSISIVVYKPDLRVISRVFSNLYAALAKVREKFGDADFSLYIIDNSTGDNHLEQLKALLSGNFSSSPFIKHELIVAEKNLGYGSANNLAIKKIQSKYHLILNPDVFVQENSLLEAIEYLESHVNIGLLSPSVFGENGERQYLCKRNPTIFTSFLRSFAPDFLKKVFTKKMDLYEMRDQDYEQEIIDVPFPTGCFMFFRTSVLQQLKGFDEKFFMYFEDADIGRRLLEISHSAYVPQVKIVHQWARDSHNNMRLRLIHVKSALTYLIKWGGIF